MAVDPPVGAQPTAVAGEHAFADGDVVSQLLWCLVLVLPVGEQDRVGERSGVLSDDVADVCQPGAHRGPAFGPKRRERTHRAGPGRRVGPDRDPVGGVDR